MPLKCINPPDIPTPETFTHVIVATGTKLVFIAGQVAEDAHGNLVGAGDMAAQARQVFANIGRALAAAGARPEQVTKLGIFVANYKREHLAEIEAGPGGAVRGSQADRYAGGRGGAVAARLHAGGRRDRGHRRRGGGGPVT